LRLVNNILLEPVSFSRVPIMPMKSSEKAEKGRRLKALKDDIDFMLFEGHITKEAHMNMIDILNEKMEKSKTNYLSTFAIPPPPNNLDVVLKRAIVPDVGDPPTHDPEPVPEAPEVSAAEEAPPPEPVAEPAPEVVAEPAPDPADEHLLGATPILSPVPEPTLADLWGAPPIKKKNKKLSMKTKKKNAKTPKEEVDPVSDWTKIEGPNMDPTMEPVVDTNREPVNVEESTGTSTVTINENEILNESKVVYEGDIGKGHLFMTCIRCTSMIMIEFESGLAPFVPLSYEDRVVNGIVMTVCKTCETKEWSMVGIKPNLVDKFKDLALHPDLLKGSDMIKAATAITNTAVDVLRSKDKVLYMDRDRTMEKLSSSDKIASVDVSKVGSMHPAKILLTHLRGGFI